jgi:hypothetical protein
VVLPGTNSDEKNHELLRNLFPDPPEDPMITTLFSPEIVERVKVLLEEAGAGCFMKHHKI